MQYQLIVEVQLLIITDCGKSEDEQETRYEIRRGESVEFADNRKQLATMLLEMIPTDAFEGEKVSE